jgi:hypothetical protein
VRKLIGLAIFVATALAAVVGAAGAGAASGHHPIYMPDANHIASPAL